MVALERRLVELFSLLVEFDRLFLFLDLSLEVIKVVLCRSLIDGALFIVALGVVKQIGLQVELVVLKFNILGFLL